MEKGIRFGFIRHGEKINPEKEEASLDSSNLTEAQKQRWAESIEKLGIKDDPQITYENMPRIEELARDIFESLPDNSLVVFTSTNYPRTRLTADLISQALCDLSFADEGKKNISVSFLWEDPKSPEPSLTEIGDMKGESAANQRLMRNLKDEQYPDDDKFERYLEKKGNTTFDREDEVLRQAVNLDLASANSQYKQRAVSFKQQLKNIESLFSENTEKVFFYMVGHHPNLITLDVALNGRTHYDKAEEIPKPLSLWEVDTGKLRDFVEGSN